MRNDNRSIEKNLEENFQDSENGKECDPINN